MSKCKKPRHTHRIKSVNIPMQTTTRNTLALDLHLAVETLIKAPSPTAYNRLSAILATLIVCKVTGDDIDVSARILIDICDRYERVGKVGVSDEEARKLRAASIGLDAKIGIIPANLFAQSKVEVRNHMQAMGAA